MPIMLVHRCLGLQEYETVWRQMRDFTDSRTPETPDEAWLLEHPPIFTLGQAGRRHHLLDPGNIPVLQVDRGGQITYHGPAQLILYLLLDLRRRGLGVRQLVSLMEQAVIGLLGSYGVEARARRDAPGVYVAERKIASLGLRVRRGCSFHGLSLNVDMDLAPFDMINPCGFRGLEVTQTSDLGIDAPVDDIAMQLSRHIGRLLETTQT